eukprot:TRINITY_DN15407_c0_g1_i1.p1 TRINITY_DN15407_c0_g1~~TRINITY_DN15407_c0_g1_i1.p1  ORF type:complete len:574 (+),score=158.62 TRINITY_DN15407_c0_g1_i1:76-1797(+)
MSLLRSSSEEVRRVRTFDEAFPEEDLDRCLSQQVLPHENSLLSQGDSQEHVCTQPLFQSPTPATPDRPTTPPSSQPLITATAPVGGWREGLGCVSQPIETGATTQPTPQVLLSERCGEEGRSLTQPLALSAPSQASCVGNPDADMDKKCIYVDRIPPVLSDADIRQALNAHLAPQGKEKVRSLEVIRTQKSKHVHAFGILYSVFEEAAEDAIIVPATNGSYIKVHKSTSLLKLPPPPTPSNTVHIRFYAMRTDNWSKQAARMTWHGLLCMLESIHPGISQEIVMVADDASQKSNTSHQSVLLCIFFCQCKSVEAATRLREAVHDKSAANWLHGMETLIRADYAKGEKQLHDTTPEKLTQLREKYAEAANYGRRVGALDHDMWQPCTSETCKLRDTHPDHLQHVCHAFTFKSVRTDRKGRKNKEADIVPTGKRAADEVSLAGTEPGMVGVVQKRGRGKRAKVDPTMRLSPGSGERSSQSTSNMPPLMEQMDGDCGYVHGMLPGSQPGFLCEAPIMTRDASQMDFTAMPGNMQHGQTYHPAPEPFQHAPYADTSLDAFAPPFNPPCYGHPSGWGS